MKLFTQHFPHIQHNSKEYNNIVVWGIGGNIGNCLKTFENLFQSLRHNSKIRLYSTSYIYKNPAFGYTTQPNFYNATITFTTNLCLRHIFTLMFYLERKFGRDRIRAFKNAPRTLDIDLIFFGNKRFRAKHLHIPHQDYHNRQSVLYPLTFQLGIVL